MTEQNFFERLRQNPHPVVVDFWAPWCGPCRMIEPTLKKVGEEYSGRVDVWKVNADEQPEVLRQLRIYGIPTVVSFHAGQEVARRTGVTSAQGLITLFEYALSGEKPARTSPAPLDRLLRASVGLALLLLAFTGFLNENFGLAYLIFAGLGGLALFSAVYDRCPIWQALAPRLKSLLRRS